MGLIKNVFMRYDIVNVYIHMHRRYTFSGSGVAAVRVLKFHYI